jgi:rhamnosyltransferase
VTGAAAPRASVVVRTLNSARTLAACLEAIRSQTVASEIVVVDSGSTDGTLAIAARLADRIVHLARPAFSYGGALNRGAAAAAAPIHFAVSSHCVLPRRDWIERSLRHYERPDVAATNGQLTRPDGSPLRGELVVTRQTPLPNPLWGFSNHASSWRADVWREEPFDETLIASEDFEWSDRVLARGLAIVFDQALLVPGDHLRAQGPLGLYRRSRRELLGTAAFRHVELPTAGAALAEWWRGHPSASARHRQLLSPYRAAVIAGRYGAGVTARRRARRGGPIGRRPAHPDAHTTGGATVALPVTVVIPAYNRAAIIERAVVSALRQQPAPPAEVLVIDDSSTDDTAELARRAGARVIRHDVNRGAGMARNTAIAGASQPWVAFLDSDDEWLPHHLASLWGARDGHVLLAGAALRCDDAGGDRYLGPVQRDGLVVRSPGDVAALPVIATSGVLMQRAAAQETGGFQALHGVEDIDLWLRVLERGTGYLSPVVSLLYHVHADQLSSEGLRLQGGRRDVLRDYADRPWCTPRVLRDWETSMTWDAARAAQRDGDLVLAARRLGRIAAHPTRVRGLAAVLVFRWRARRRTSRVGRSGAPTLAVIGAGPARDVDGYEPVRPSGGSRLARYAGLARRPTAALLVEGRGDRVAARLLRIEALEGR